MKKNRIIVIIFVIIIVILSLVFLKKKDSDKINIKNIDNTKNTEIVYPKDTYTGVNELFSLYKTEIKNTKLLSGLDEESREKWSEFKTKIEEGSTQDVNFAGNYIIVEWGCGTECHSGAIIDAGTGKIYELPTSELGLKYSTDSSLLIVNPPFEDETMNNDRASYAYPAYYIWKDNKLELLHDTRA